MVGAGRVRDEAPGEHWKQSLVGVTGTAGAVRRGQGVHRSPRARACGSQRAVAPREGAADSNRLPTRRRARRLTASAVVLGTGLVGCAAVIALSPVRVEHVPLACPVGVSVSWADQYRGVLGLRVPDPRDHLEVVAVASSTVKVTFTDAAGAVYPTVRGEMPPAGRLALEPPRPVPPSERALWTVEAAVWARGSLVATCAGALS